MTKQEIEREAQKLEVDSGWIRLIDAERFAVHMVNQALDQAANVVIAVEIERWQDMLKEIRALKIGV